MFWAGIVLIDSWPNFQHHLLTSGKLTTILGRWDMCRRLLNMDSHFFQMDVICDRAEKYSSLQNQWSAYDIIIFPLSNFRNAILLVFCSEEL